MSLSNEKVLKLVTSLDVNVKPTFFFFSVFSLPLTSGPVIAGRTRIRRAKRNRWGEGKYYYLHKTYIPYITYQPDLVSSGNQFL